MALIMIKTIIVYSYSAISLIGLITNSISFYIFSRKRFRNTIFSTYFRFYLVFQTLNLIYPINKIFEFNYAAYFSNISNFTCWFRFYFGYVNFAIVSWFLAVISVDRYLSICYSSKYLLRKKLSFQLLISLFLIIFNICYYVPFCFHYLKETTINSTNSTTKVSVFKCVSPGIWIDIMDLFQQILIPFFFMILFTFLTAKNVFRSRKINNFSTNSSTSKTISNDRKFAISSITLNILFLLFNLPHILLKIINQMSSYLYLNHYNLLRIIQSISYFFFFLNLSSTFFINLYVNSMFKSELELIVFGRSRQDSKNNKMHTIQTNNENL